MVGSATVPTTTPVADGTLYYHQDGLGTVTELTDVQRQRPKPTRMMRTGIFWSHRVRWSSPIRIREESWMQSQGLYYYRARYYDAQIGKFTQRDPIGRVGGNNYYEYALWKSDIAL